MDLRERVVQGVLRGSSHRVVAQQFSISLATVGRWLRLQRQSGSVAPRPLGGVPRRLEAKAHPRLEAQLRSHGDATLAQHCALWEQEPGQRLSRATMGRAIARVGYTRKKRA